MEEIISNNEIAIQEKKFWQFPWKYKQGFILVLGILVFGFILEAITQAGPKIKIHFPANVIALLALVNIIFLLHTYAKTNPFIRWLSTVPAAISSISLFVFLALLIGFVPQSPKSSGFLSTIGITHVTSSIPYLLSQFYFFITLGLVTLRRSIPFKGKNIGFFLNHAGLWITLAAAGLGSGDLLRLQMPLQAGADFTNVAYTSDSKPYQLTVALKLIQFQVEEYNPKIAVISTKSGEIQYSKSKNMIEVSKGLHTSIADWEIYIREFYKDAIVSDSIFIPKSQIGSAPAIFAEVRNKKSGLTYKGWVSNGSFMMPWKQLPLDHNLALGMANPEPKKFSSKVEYLTKEVKHGETTVGHGFTVVEVNKPFKLDVWKIYQASYETDYGKYSPTSTLELVYDRWLPVVYIGIFMLMAGAIYIFWIGRKRKES